MLNVFNQSLWGDEAFSAVLSMKPVTQIVSIITRDTSPPLFNLTEHFWYSLFGTGEIAIRALVFLYFLAACFFVYKIGETLWNRRIGLLSAILTFLNPFFFSYGFEGRMYSLLAVTVCASMYFFVRLLFSKKIKFLDKVGYVLSTAAALYSHHFAIFALFVQGLWFLIYLIKNRKRVYTILILFIVTGLIYSPWLIPLYNQTKMVGTGFWLGKPTITDFFGLLGKYLTTGINNPLAKIALVFALIILVSRNWLEDKEKSLFLISWFLLPILICWLISQKFTSIFFDRYLLYTIPAAMILLASGVRKISLPFILLLVSFFLIIDFSYFTHPTKLPFRDLANYVKEVKRGDDYLINWNSASHHLWESIYYGIPAPLYVPQGTLPYYVGTALMTKEDVVSAVPKGTNRVGVITSGAVEEISLPGFSKDEEKDFGALKFLWYTRSF